MVKIKTNLCYSIFESCNGAQEVKGRAAPSTVATDFGSGLTGNVSLFLSPPSSNYAKAIKSLKRREL